VSLCLTKDELVSLTGRKQPKRMITWLTENGWRFFVGADGIPKVDREYYRERVGTTTEKKKRVVRTEGLSRGASTN
jgi:hypothetical protein